ncbi:MAG TPA: hydroxymethylbilane synthase, partial [Blastocatellia bacterium]|nr:hydroxymethylbilane synthase [Blastocatellia bacterium]
ILAAAGLHRLGFTERITEHLAMGLVLPAAGQGALAIETRSDDEAVNDIVGKLNHEATQLACQAERAFLKGLGGGCLVPIAAHAEIAETTLTLAGLVASTDGSEIVRGNVAGPAQEAERLGQQLARELIGQGAGQILARG